MPNAPCTVGGLRLLKARLAIPYIGAWHGELEADFAGSQLAVSGDGMLEVEIDGAVFCCSATRAPRVHGGRLRCSVVGGHGGLGTQLDPMHYVETTALAVVRDILTDTGETLADTADSALLGSMLASWERTEGPASRALTRVCAAVGAIWRVLEDGTVWIGSESYPAATVAHQLIDEDWTAGLIEIASQSPTLTPGVTFLGQRIRYVVHHLDEGSLRTEAYLETPGGLLDRVLAGIRQDVVYSRVYPATVVAQNADLTLQLHPDDDAVRGSGLDRVPVRVGLPGFRVRVRDGARVRLGFDGGDPSRPYAALWDDGDPDVVESVEFAPDGIGAPLVRVGGTLQCALPAGVPVTGLLNGQTFIGTITLTTPILAIAQSGNGKLLG